MKKLDAVEWTLVLLTAAFLAFVAVNIYLTQTGVEIKW